MSLEYASKINLEDTSAGFDMLRNLICINSSDIISPGLIKANDKIYNCCVINFNNYTPSDIETQKIVFFNTNKQKYIKENLNNFIQPKIPNYIKE